jgi:hypothetical protein
MAEGLLGPKEPGFGIRDSGFARAEAEAEAEVLAAPSNLESPIPLS